MLAGGEGEESRPRLLANRKQCQEVGAEEKGGKATDGFYCLRGGPHKMAATFSKGLRLSGGVFLLDSEEVTNKGWLPVRLDLNSSSSRTFIPSERRKFIIFLSGASGTECDLPFNRGD